MRKPIRPAEFKQRVNEALTQVRRQRRWPRKRVVGGFRVTIKGRPAAVVDVSYGGLRLELPDGEPLPGPFDVEVAGIGLHLEVEPVWSQASGGTRDGVRGHPVGRTHAVRPDLARDRRSPERLIDESSDLRDSTVAAPC